MEKFEIWTVEGSEGHYYTLKDNEGNTQEFMKLGVPLDELEEGDKVLILYKDGLRSITSKAVHTAVIN